MGSDVVSEGFAKLLVVVGKEVGIKVFVRGLAGALVDVLHLGKMSDLQRSEGPVEGGEVVGVTAFESRSPEDRAQSELALSVGPGVGAFVEFVTDYFGL